MLGVKRWARLLKTTRKRYGSRRTFSFCFRASSPVVKRVALEHRRGCVRRIRRVRGQNNQWLGRSHGDSLGGRPSVATRPLDNAGRREGVGFSAGHASGPKAPQSFLRAHSHGARRRHDLLARPSRGRFLARKLLSKRGRPSVDPMNLY